MTDTLKHVQELISKRKLPALEHADRHAEQPLDITTNNTANPGSIQKVDLEAVHRKLGEELEDKRKNADAVKELFIYQPEETVWNRFKGLFLKNEYGFRSCEFRFACAVGSVAAIAGVCFRGKAKFEASIARFKVQHNLSLFESKRDYMSRVTTFVGYNWLVDNIPRGLKIGSLAFCSSLTTLGLARLRDEAKFYDVVAGYALAGFLYRFQRGMRSALSAAVIGIVLGSIIPLIMLPILYFDGRTLDAIYKEMRQQDFSDKLKDQKLGTEILEAMRAYDIGYFAARKRVQEWREGERTRIATAYHLNREAALSGRRDMSEE